MMRKVIWKMLIISEIKNREILEIVACTNKEE